MTRSAAMFEAPRAVALTAGAYAALGMLAVAIAESRGVSPATLVATEGWLPWETGVRLMVSLTLGTVIAAVTVLATPVITQRSAAASELQRTLRTATVGLGNTDLALMAAASGMGEELLFRGALTPWIGVVASSAAFAALHQVRGRARWVWIGWAFAMGLLLAMLFSATGHLAGAVVAHVLINGQNLRFVRDRHEPPKRRVLGGILKNASIPAELTSAERVRFTVRP